MYVLVLAVVDIILASKCVPAVPRVYLWYVISKGWSHYFYCQQPVAGMLAQSGRAGIQYVTKRRRLGRQFNSLANSIFWPSHFAGRNQRYLILLTHITATASRMRGWGTGSVSKAGERERYDIPKPAIGDFWLQHSSCSKSYDKCVWED
jgi:hypothetical protein